MKHISTFDGFLNEGRVEYIGPFVISDMMSDEELKQMHTDAVEGYANWQSGFYYKKADYRKAYETIEDIAKKRGLKL
jgi:hypothetical protein